MHLHNVYTLDERHAWFHLYGASRPARSASEATKYKMRNTCTCQEWDSNPQPWDLKSDVLPVELRELFWKLYYLNDLLTYMFFRYTIDSAPSYRAVSSDYLCIFHQTRPNDGYVVQFCKQYLDRLYACLDAIKVLFTKLDHVTNLMKDT